MRLGTRDLAAARVSPPAGVQLVSTRQAAYCWAGVLTGLCRDACRAGRVVVLAVPAWAQSTLPGLSDLRPGTVVVSTASVQFTINFGNIR